MNAMNRARAGFVRVLVSSAELRSDEFGLNRLLVTTSLARGSHEASSGPSWPLEALWARRPSFRSHVLSYRIRGLCITIFRHGIHAEEHNDPGHQRHPENSPAPLPIPDGGRHPGNGTKEAHRRHKER